MAEAPAAPRAERAALSCLLTAAGDGDREAVARILDQLRPSFVHDERRRLVLNVARVLVREGSIPDSVLLQERLAVNKSVQEELGAILNQNLPPSFLSNYLPTLREVAAKRAFWRMRDEAGELAQENGTFVDKLELFIEASRNARDELEGEEGLPLMDAQSMLEAPVSDEGVLLPPAYLNQGDVSVLAGAPGVGKTRLILGLAAAQITGQDWCGLTTMGAPHHWMLLATESGVRRYQRDLRPLLDSLGVMDRAQVIRHLHLMDNRDPALRFMDLPEDRRAAERLARTLRPYRRQPLAIVCDPLVNFGEGNTNDPSVMRQIVQSLMRTVFGEAPNAALLLVHHGRIGREAAASGIGWDAAAFGLGSKALVGMARCQINVMPGDLKDPLCVVLSCGKVNDCPPFDPRAARYDFATGRYEVDSAFDLEKWQKSLRPRRVGRGSAPEETSEAALAAVLAAVRQGHNKSEALYAAVMRDRGCSLRWAKTLLAEARIKGLVERVFHGVYALGPNAEPPPAPAA